MIKVEVKVEDSEVTRRLRKVATAMSPRARADYNMKAAIAMYGYVIRVFDAQGAHDGRPGWQPLKAGGRTKVTQHADGTRSRRFQSDHKILQDTGALKESYWQLHDENYAGVGALSMRKHADLAAVHQFGNPAKNLPARPMLPEPDVALRIVSQVYGFALQEAVKR